jgi:DNA replicative helicase MCM subunit Mcm2 (Cdc46/Mcm family)
MPETSLHSLFSALFAYARDKLRGQATIDDITKAAKAALESMAIEEAQLSWTNAPTIGVTEAKRCDSLHHPVFILARVTHLEDPGVVSIPTDDTTIKEDVIVGKVTGLDTEVLALLPAVGTTLVRKLQQAQREGALVRITGMVVSVPARMSKSSPVAKSDIQTYALHVIDVEATTSCMDLLGASAEERDETRELLQALRAEGRSPFAYLAEQVIQGLNIVGSKDITHLLVAIRFVVLQALSSGQVGNASGRLHLLLIGPPGQGKKLVGLAARALNPVCCEASASKVSPAGLVGASYQTGQGWASTPGLLPLASDGVLVVQDVHGWSRPQMGRIAPILQELVEDGVVRDAVAGGATRIARTALVLDANRQGQLGAFGGRGEAPILTVLPLLSRIDCMIEIPLDLNRSWRVAEQMYGAFGTSDTNLERAPWVRRVRLLVALLRDEYPEIDDSQVTEELRAVHREIESANATVMEVTPQEASAIPIRMAVTMTRLVRASARAHYRKVATSEDVQLARMFLAFKLKFMGLVARRAQVSDCPADRQRRREEYYSKYEGQEVTAAQVEADVRDDLGDPVDNRTIRRDLRRLGATQRNGRWLLPPRRDK